MPAITKSCILHLVFQTGVDANEDAILKGKTYSNVKSTATVQQLVSVGTAIGALQVYPLVSVERMDTQLLN